MVSVRPYAPADTATWDALVARSRQGNLLHRRGYMDYHADRFHDASLLVEQRGEPVAVFPANRDGDLATSHAGLSYGGLLATPALRAEATVAALERIGEHYRAAGVRRLRYKAVPHVFHRGPAEEDLYALVRLGARLVRRDLSSMIDLRAGARLDQARRRAWRRGLDAGIRVQADDDLPAFHALLTAVLQRHAVAPTHSLAELQLLHARFPGAIVLHTARADGELLAGALIYDFGHAVHTQYLAASDAGRERDALSVLLAELVAQVYADRHWFSFGISTEQDGRVLNAGLVEQKERFGARAVVHDHYEWTL